MTLRCDDSGEMIREQVWMEGNRPERQSIFHEGVDIPAIALAKARDVKASGLRHWRRQIRRGGRYEDHARMIIVDYLESRPRYVGELGPLLRGE